MVYNIFLSIIKFCGLNIAFIIHSKHVHNFGGFMFIVFLDIAEGVEVDLQSEIRVNKEFDPNLSDPETPAYKEMVELVIRSVCSFPLCETNS